MRKLSFVGLLVALALPLATAQAQDAAQEPASPRNYTDAASRTIDMIVIHKAEGSAASTWSWFQNPAAQCSAHYVVADDGAVTQMVPDHDIAWHAGNWSVNERSIGIENEGYTNRDDVSDVHLRALARLTRTLCDRYGIPKDRGHIIGHSEVPDPDHPGEFGGSGHHTDPGPSFNWPLFMKYVLGEDQPAPPPAAPAPADAPAPPAPAASAPAPDAPAAPAAPAPKAPEDLTVAVGGESDGLSAAPGENVISGPDALDKLVDEIADPRRKTGELPKLGKLTLEDAPNDPLRDLRWVCDVLDGMLGLPAVDGLDASFADELAQKLAQRGLTPDDVFAPDARVVVTSTTPEGAEFGRALAKELPTGAAVVDASRSNPGFVGPIAPKTIPSEYHAPVASAASPAEPPSVGMANRLRMME